MKKEINKALSLILAITLMFLSTSLSNFDFSVMASDTSTYTEGIYTYTVGDGKATITTCDKTASGIIEIPSELGGYPVVKLAIRAFENCDLITGVTIPDSVTGLGDGVFDSCSALKEVTIPGSVKIVPQSAFDKCSKLSKVILGEGIEKISYCAFWRCGSLKTITLPQSLLRINDDAFKDTGLTKIYIPENVSQIGEEVFYSCENLSAIEVDENNSYFSSDSYGALFNKNKTKLIVYPLNNTATSYSIPDSVIEVSAYAFEGNAYLTKIVIPDGVKAIWGRTFYSCVSLQEINIPASVIYLYSSTFINCKKLERINVDSNNNTFSSDEYGVLYNKDKTQLIHCPNNANISEYIVSDFVTSVEAYAFDGNLNLEEITIGSGLSEIKSDTFNGCRNLSRVILGENIATINGGVFFSCNSLSEIKLPQSLKQIGTSAFAFCNNLTDVYYGGSELQWAEISVSSGNDPLTKANIHYVEDKIYTIMYDANYGVSAPDSQEKHNGLKINLSTAVPSKEVTVTFDPNYVNAARSSKTFTSGFISWNTKIDGSGISYIPGAEYTADEDVTLFAQWHNKPVGEFSVVTRYGYTFAGWYADGGTESVTQETVFEKDTTVYARWIPEEYKAVFIADDTIVDEVTYTVETDKLTEPIVPEKEGYTGSWEPYVLSQSDIEINAIYTVNQYTITWVIDENENVVSNIVFGEEISNIDTPRKGGLIFVGWDKDIPATMPAENLIFTAIWRGPDETAVNESGTCGEAIEWKYDTKTGELMFSGYGDMPEYDSVTLAPWYNQNNNITKVTFTDGITSVGDNAFGYCVNLKTVCFNSTIERIGTGAFKGCSSIENIDIPSNVLIIDSEAFADCESLKRIHIEGQLTLASDVIENTQACFCSDSERVVRHITAQGCSVCLCDYETSSLLGIKAYYHTKDFETDKVKLSVEDITNKDFSGDQKPVYSAFNGDYSKSKTYRIKMVPENESENSNPCQPQNGSVVKLRINIDLDTDTIVVVHWKHSGGTEKLFCQKQKDSSGSYIEFYVSSFSEFDVCVPLDFGYDTASESLLYKQTISPALRNNTNEKIIYASSNPKVAYVDPDTGVVTATGSGTAEITATIANTNISSSFEVTVTMAWWQWIIRILLLGFLWY
ncbi:MAG: leucine-rich repeat protein [Clostridia bacterium]|nr:leucine-rich repeat protein [Clostridia bacterium]